MKKPHLYRWLGLWRCSGPDRYGNQRAGVAPTLKQAFDFWKLIISK